MIDALDCSVATVDARWSDGTERMQYSGVLFNCFFNAPSNRATRKVGSLAPNDWGKV